MASWINPFKSSEGQSSCDPLFKSLIDGIFEEHTQFPKLTLIVGDSDDEDRIKSIQKLEKRKYEVETLYLDQLREKDAESYRRCFEEAFKFKERMSGLHIIRQGKVVCSTSSEAGGGVDLVECINTNFPKNEA
mmetsp:Transcript_16963/g.28715  ORF Transcript_16963/g.28715 Transcript_16963/m.28715 type:complete len:133 (-) Transcript_16963:8-406(-)